MLFQEITGLEPFIDCKQCLKTDKRLTYEQSLINVNKEKGEWEHRSCHQETKQALLY